MRESKKDTCVYLRLQWRSVLREGLPRGSILSFREYPCFILDKSRYSLTERFTRGSFRFSFSPFFLFFFSRRVVSGRVIEAFLARTTLSGRVCTRDENRIREPRRYASCHRKYPLEITALWLRDRLKMAWTRSAFRSRLPARVYWQAR